MPLIVQPEHYGWWIGEGNGGSPRGPFAMVLDHPDKDELYYQPVNRALNNVRNEGPELLQIEKTLL